MENPVVFRRRKEPKKTNEEMVVTTDGTEYEFDEAFAERMRNGTSTPNDQFELQIGMDRFERYTREDQLKLKRLTKPAYLDVCTQIENEKRGSNDEDRIRFLEHVESAISGFLMEEFKPLEDLKKNEFGIQSTMGIDDDSPSIILYYLEKGFPDLYVTMDENNEYVIYHPDPQSTSARAMSHLIQCYRAWLTELNLKGEDRLNEMPRYTLENTFLRLLWPE